MYFIVIGGGRVGYYLIRELLSEGHEVLIVEQQGWVCERINEELGSVCVQGDGCEAALLAEIGTGRADMFVAVTGDDEDNMVACQVAKRKFDVPTTIARIRNPRNKVLFKKLGINVTVSSTDIILEHIQQQVPTHALTHLLTINGMGKRQEQEIVGVKVPPESAAVGKFVRQLSLPKGSKLALVIRREGKHRLPTSNTIIRAGDRVVVLTTPGSEAALEKVLSGTPAEK